MRTLAALFLLILCLQAACLPVNEGAGTVGEADNLSGTEWQLAAYGPAGAEMPALANTAVTANFADGQLQGSAGCNGYSTTYTVDGRSLSLGPIAVTEMACLEPGAMEQEAAFLAALSTAATYELASDLLVIHFEDGVIRFIPNVPPLASPLEGPLWQLATLEQREGAGVMASPVPEGMLVTLMFQAGQLSGSTGCNEFGAPYQVEGERLVVEAIIKTEALCPNESQIMTESQFFNGLAQAESFSISGEQLTLSYPNGRLFFVIQNETNSSSTSPSPEQIVPPPAMLTVGDTAQSAGIGTYCWSGPPAEETVHLCVDTVGIATPVEPLPINAGPVQARLSLPLEEAPTHLLWTTFPVSAADEQANAAGASRWWNFADIEPVGLLLQAEQELELDLPPGLHVVQISAWWEGVGDVVYGFLLESEPIMTADIEQAQAALADFFEHLRDSRYSEAAALYGGSPETMIDHNPDVDPADLAGLLQRACEINGAVCLAVETAEFTGQPAPGQYDFQVRFILEDGSSYQLELPELPAQNQFPMTVGLTETGSYQIVSPLVYGP